MKKASFSLPDRRQLIWYETGQGHPLVLLHGWSMSAAVFSEIATLLSPSFRLLIPDLPGHGESSPAPKNTLPGISADLACWLTATIQAPVTLVGWSLGGMLALELSHRHQALAERLVLIGTTPRFTLSNDWSFGLPLAQIRALERNLARRFEATLGDFFSLAFAGENLSPERMRAIRSFAVRQSPLPNPGVAAGLLALLEAQDQRAILTEISQPALVLHGDLDQIAPIEAGRYLAQMLPQGVLAEIAGIGHGPFLSQPKAVVAMIREFC